MLILRLSRRMKAVNLALALGASLAWAGEAPSPRVFIDEIGIPTPLTQALSLALNEHQIAVGEQVRIALVKSLNDRKGIDFFPVETLDEKSDEDILLDNEERRLIILIQPQSEEIRIEAGLKYESYPDFMEDLREELEEVLDEGGSPSEIAPRVLEATLKFLESPLIENNRLIALIPSLAKKQDSWQLSLGWLIFFTCICLLLGLVTVAGVVYLHLSAETHITAEGAFRVNAFRKFVEDLKKKASGKKPLPLGLGGASGRW